MSEHDQNRRVAEKMCQEFAWDGQPLHEGDCVAILDGIVIAVARKPDEAIASLRKADPNPRRGMVIEISRPNPDVIRRISPLLRRSCAS